KTDILHAYTPDETIIAAAIPLFGFIAFYQIFDAIQVVVAFILRAYKITVIPTLLYAFSLWGCGLGGGYLIGLNPPQIIPTELHGATGFWFANTISIALAAVTLWLYLAFLQKKSSDNKQSSTT
ncbi:MAG: MATE family efflux transporter, partial [Burkholderiales bacterium]|nr:MATE family efflux transporter [Burkholderiales bacterium]